MTWETIRKSRADGSVSGNLDDYDAVSKSFDWSDARGLLDGLPGGGLNIAYEAVDRHIANGRGDKVALRWIARDGMVRDYAYRDLAEQSNKFANVLASLGVGKGDRVYSLIGRVPELYIAALGTWKNGSVFSPLFSAFGPEPIKARMSSLTLALDIPGWTIITSDLSFLTCASRTIVVSVSALPSTSPVPPFSCRSFSRRSNRRSSCSGIDFARFIFIA